MAVSKKRKSKRRNRKKIPQGVPFRGKIDAWNEEERRKQFEKLGLKMTSSGEYTPKKLAKDLRKAVLSEQSKTGTKMHLEGNIKSIINILNNSDDTNSDFFRDFVELHDKYKLSPREIAFAFAKKSLPSIKSKSLLSIIEKVTDVISDFGQSKYGEEFLKNINPLANTEKQKVKFFNNVIGSLGARVSSSNELLVANLFKSLEYYPEGLDDIIKKQLELKGTDWYIGRSNSKVNYPLLEIVLSSDDIIIRRQLYAIIRFFELSKFDDQIPDSHADKERLVEIIENDYPMMKY